MHSESLVFTIFLIFTGAAVFSTIALYTRQSLFVGYILLGILLGPWGLKLVTDATQVKQIGDVGIIFLLFLLGLHLQPQNLLHMLKKVTLVAAISSIAFLGLGFFVCYLFNFSIEDSLIVGAAVMFSSTIIGLKLLPTTILHHQHTGEVMIGVLLMQDLLAIVVLLLLEGTYTGGGLTIEDILFFLFALPGLLLLAFLVEHYILVKLLARFDRTQEYVFLLSIGWCLGMAQLASVIQLTGEIGAFLAGVVLAENPISLYIAESLKPLRDFFLVMFFFYIGASFNFHFLPEIAAPTLLLTLLLLVLKPVIFYFLFRYEGESKSVSKEVGVRLGQASEFSLLIASFAMSMALLSARANSLIQATTIFTFIVSSYLVVLNYPTPIALTDKLRRD